VFLTLAGYFLDLLSVGSVFELLKVLNRLNRVVPYIAVSWALESTRAHNCQMRMYNRNMSILNYLTIILIMMNLYNT
jgi:hypothetical protein